jgi:long-chain fatty acid transport protein
MKCSATAVSMAVAAALAATGADTAASGFQLMEQNASGLGNAYAGQAAAAEDASTVFWNPAGLTRLPGRQVTGAFHLIRPSNKLTLAPGSSAPLGLPSPAGSGGDAGGWAAVPNLYGSWQIGPQWWLGLGITVPFGLATDYDQGWVGRFQGQFAEIKTLDINPSVAYKVNDVLSVGAGVSYQMAEVKVERSAILPPGAEARTAFRIDGDGLGFNAGALIQLSPATRIGLAYRAAIKHDLEGPIHFATATTSAAQNVRMSAKLPDTISWGIAHQLTPQWEVLGDVTYTRWSRIKSLPLVATSGSVVAPAGTTLSTFEFEFRDTYRVGVGANWKMRGDLTLKFGVAYDKSPVTDIWRTVTLPDNDRTWLAVGGKLRMSKQMTVDVGYTYIFVKDAPINQQRGVGAAPFQGNVIGTYKGDVNIFSAQLTYSF